MSWEDPQPPVLPFGTGLLTLTLTLLVTVGLLYLLLA